MKYTIEDVSFEISKLPNKKKTSLLISFSDENCCYKVADFDSDDKAKWTCDVIELLLEKLGVNVIKV